MHRRDTENFGFKPLRSYVFAMHWLVTFRPIFWLALARGCLVVARRCPVASRRVVSALSLSSLVYLGTYFFVGVASNFRYAYWAVLATSACAVVLACEAVAGLARRRQGTAEA